MPLNIKDADTHALAKRLASLTGESLKGTSHGADPNYGDCFSYALAKYPDAPLLFKGNDFSQTDIASAVG